MGSKKKVRERGGVNITFCIKLFYILIFTLYPKYSIYTNLKKLMIGFSCEEKLF